MLRKDRIHQIVVEVVTRHAERRELRLAQVSDIDNPKYSNIQVGTGRLRDNLQQCHQGFISLRCIAGKSAGK